MKKSFFLTTSLFIVFSCNHKTENPEMKAAKQDTLKQKNGTVLTYKKPDQNLILLKRDQSVYSDAYQNRLRKIAEYYLAHSTQSLVKFHTSKMENRLGYSVQENDWEDVNYTQIGIFSKSGNNLSTMQWLFYEPESQKLYEFDLNTKKLVEFKMGN